MVILKIKIVEFTCLRIMKKSDSPIPRNQEAEASLPSATQCVRMPFLEIEKFINTPHIEKKADNLAYFSDPIRGQSLLIAIFNELSQPTMFYVSNLHAKAPAPPSEIIRMLRVAQQKTTPANAHVHLSQ
jgi:hypothetical protein